MAPNRETQGKRKLAPKKKLKLWNVEAMASAIRRVIKDKESIRVACGAENVPRGTLANYIKRVREQNVPDEEIESVISSTRMGVTTIFPPHLEDELVKYCQLMDEKFFGLTKTDVQRYAYQLAVKNKFQHRFSKTQTAAGKYWLSSFKARHPHIKFRKPQTIWAEKGQAFRSGNVELYLELLKLELEKVSFNPARVYSCDETGITVMPNHPQPIGTFKGRKMVCERLMTTVITCMSASGSFVPPMIIHKEQMRTSGLSCDTPPGSLVEYSSSGWTSIPLFSKWFRHFLQHVRPTSESPVVLILDGRYCHTRSLNLITLARDNHVSLVCLPPQTFRVTQPLDVSLITPFESNEIGMDIPTGSSFSHQELMSVFTGSYSQLANTDRAIDGFRRTGILPYNPEILLDIVKEARSIGQTVPDSEDSSTSETSADVTSTAGESSLFQGPTSDDVTPSTAGCSRSD